MPETGKYKLEVWGASGGTKGRYMCYGGYTRGCLVATKNSTMYIFIGGMGGDDR
ncbi:glycine rich domain-containing protein [Xylanibacter rodentium]|uniref:glycine rich domain-containing protein n=1 Tax=Xylanibacter rodentium TaxID=2736289 RepID=UPI003364D8F5